MDGFAQAPSSSVAATVRLVRAHDVTVYKVVAGGGDTTLSAYNDSCRRGHCPGPGPSAPDDWGGCVYTQFSAIHALGTIPYRWDRGHDEARLVSAALAAPLDVVVADGPSMHDGRVAGTPKATSLKKALGIDPGVPLMDALAVRRQVLMVRETEDWWELLFPHALLENLVYGERGVALFQRHPKGLPLTHRWRIEGVGRIAADGDQQERWRVWHDEEDTALCVPDLGIEWLEQGAEAAV
mmetsp:Transcript_16853/g.33555  ORF Transcript_16853/g.33555 Transcript_16853/m.33555 type:complete len:239 (-) Transcript_16853:228-944(-)